MKKYTNKVLKIVPYIVLSILVGVTAVYAGSTLTPPASVSNTMYSLTDIYNLASGKTADEGTGEIDATPSEVSLSGKSLSDVYEAISTEIAKLTPSILLSGNTVFGVEGGVEEVGVNPTLTWQEDPALYLCWSHNQYEIDGGCVIGNGFIQTPDAINILGAVEYCKYLNEDGTTLANSEQNIWHLPTIQELPSTSDWVTYKDTTNFNGFDGDGAYWSISEYSNNIAYTWYWYNMGGGVDGYTKVRPASVRCVR